MLFISVFPLLMQLYISLTDWSPLSGRVDAGLVDVEQLCQLHRPDGRQPAVGGSWAHGAGDGGLCAGRVFAGAGLATLFMDDFPGKRLAYSILIMPMMVVPAVAGYMFFMLFQSGGPVNDILSLV